MSSTAKSALLDEYALIARALAAPARLVILEQLAQRPLNVDALAQRTGLALANCSQHLRQLHRAGLVTSRRAGKAVVYSLRDDETLKAMAILRRLAERNRAEAERILRGLMEGADPPEPVGRAELQRRLDDGSATVLDMRPADEFAAAHIPGARNVALAALGAMAPALSRQARRGHAIIAYCRGPYCIYADQAVALLRRAGIDAARLDGGLPEWRADGRPVAGAQSEEAVSPGT